ncbi:7-carboxy-7-deazaguanine synthase QueE [Pontibacter sp. G13]|uniref:7-carboxy-7-deazaguanine synthase QueE n=1 Tax=Pontibacter sp. G13 TaxID=3074898 RepID=UPI00288913CD|nr:7-carboxy-7-deazaguanine synthase QueE [Pontibacter sp. G13]WNJ16098.1 7-carboxy-7-deazaguanine synthase QueE [Pontibacter sp. G13]
MLKTKRQEIDLLLKRGQQDPLPIMEQFYTLQGEGAWSGTASWFVRLAGCDVGCHWCDVKESWTPAEDQYQSCDSIVAKALEAGANRVVITGGEPSIYNLTTLTQKLKEAGLAVHIETAGPHPLTGTFDWVTFSPKKFLPAKDEYYQRAHELKIVIFNERDLEWAEEHAARCADHVQLYLQTEWSRRDRISPKLVEYVKQNPKWRLSIQTHKYIDIP